MISKNIKKKEEEKKVISSSTFLGMLASVSLDHFEDQRGEEPQLENLGKLNLIKLSQGVSTAQLPS